MVIIDDVHSILISRYDYPDPGSTVDYFLDNLVEYILYYEGVSLVKFKKKITNIKPFVSKRKRDFKIVSLRDKITFMGYYC